jgi:hypothetical protein
MMLAQAFLPCVKDLNKFHEPKLVALAPPTYVHRLELWESNVYQMMLRYKRWTFEA